MQIFSHKSMLLPPLGSVYRGKCLLETGGRVHWMFPFHKKSLWENDITSPVLCSEMNVGTGVAGREGEGFSSWCLLITPPSQPSSPTAPLHRAPLNPQAGLEDHYANLYKATTVSECFDDYTDLVNMRFSSRLWRGAGQDKPEENSRRAAAHNC